MTSYQTAHGKVRGLARNYSCATGCGKQARHWAYDHTDPNELVDRDGRPYSRSIYRYNPMCPGCHLRFDNSVRSRGKS